MSKIAFINPSVDKYSEIRTWSSDLINYMNGRSMTVMPRLTAMTLAALTPAKHSFTYIDEEIEDIVFDKIDADIIAITAMTIQARRAYEIAGEFRKRGATVIMGGIHASVLPDEAGQYADAICIGEGENVWPAMLEDFEAGVLKSRYDAKDYPPVTALVSPRTDIFDPSHYFVYPVITSKGCPYNCEFCSIRFSSGHKIRLKPVAQVVEEIKALEKLNGKIYKKTYQFVDDNLYANREHAIELFTAVKDLHISWSGQGSLDTAMDDEVVRLMAEAGCQNFSIGFESLSEDSLKEANKTVANQVEKYKSAVQNLTRYGIVPEGFFICGFDSDDKSVFKTIVDFVMEANLINPYINILTPYPGTRLYKRVEHRLCDNNWSHYGIRSVFTPAKMTSRELETGLCWAYSVTMDLETVKKQLVKFWSNGPWKSNPALTLKERLILLFIGFQLYLNKNFREYSGFLFWAATRRKAATLFVLIQALHFADMTKRFISRYSVL